MSTPSRTAPGAAVLSVVTKLAGTPKAVTPVAPVSLFGSPAAVERQKSLSVTPGLWIRIPATAVDGVSGLALSSSPKGHRVEARKPMTFTAANALLMFVPCAIALNRWESAGSADATFDAVRTVAVVTGAISLARMGSHVLDGLKPVRSAGREEGFLKGYLGPGLRGRAVAVQRFDHERSGGRPDPAVDPQHPWLGLASFTEETRGFFYGREEEVAELARRVQRKLLTVLFGQSGLGKTSMLRAGLVPRLRPEGYCPVYVRIDYGRDTPPPSEQIKQAIYRETLASGSWTQSGVAVEGESLWEFLHHRDDVLRDSAGRTLTPLLIFDQFEEIFTLAQTDDFGRQRAAQFIADLADLVENRPPKALEARLDEDDAAVERFDFARSDYRILIALREDYLAHAEGLKGAMPSITQNRMRVARMTGAQALDAVLKPGGSLVSRDVAEAIVRFVAGGSELANAEVEPSLLSLICRELNNARIAQGRSEISRTPASSPSSTSGRWPTSRPRCACSSRRNCSPSRASARTSPRSGCARPSRRPAPLPMRWRPSSTEGCCASRSGSTCAASS